MTESSSRPSADVDLATMLAEMDSRLQQLQRELEEVAVPITRRGVPPYATGRPVVKPTRSASAQVDEGLEEMQRGGAPAAPPPAAPPPAAPPPAAPTPAPPRGRERRTTAVSGEPATAPAPRPAASAAPVPTPETLVRHTILEAEREAQRIVEDARARIAAIGARTRAQLEQSLAQPAAAAAPALASAHASAGAPVRPPSSAEDRVYDGAVTVEAGPFDDVAQLQAFQDALGSVPGVEEVYIRTFERYYAHFELRIARPTLLIAELRTRTPDPLRVVDATSQDLRLEIIRDGTAA